MTRPYWATGPPDHDDPARCPPRPQLSLELPLSHLDRRVHKKSTYTMARACAISRSVAGCIARRRRRGEIWPPPQQQPFDALFPPDTGCCAARAPGIRSASPGSTIIRSQLVRSPKIRRKPFVQSSRRNEWVAPFVQYSVDDAQISTAARP